MILYRGESFDPGLRVRWPQLAVRVGRRASRGTSKQVGTVHRRCIDVGLVGGWLAVPGAAGAAAEIAECASPTWTIAVDRVAMRILKSSRTQNAGKPAARVDVTQAPLRRVRPEMQRQFPCLCVRHYHNDLRQKSRHYGPQRSNLSEPESVACESRPDVLNDIA